MWLVGELGSILRESLGLGRLELPGLQCTITPLRQLHRCHFNATSTKPTPTYLLLQPPSVVEPPSSPGTYLTLSFAAFQVNPTSSEKQNYASYIVLNIV